MGELGGRAVEFGVGEVPGAVGGGDPVGIRGDAGSEDIGQCAGRQRRGHHVGKGAGGLGVVEYRKIAHRERRVGRDRVEQSHPRAVRVAAVVESNRSVA